MTYTLEEKYQLVKEALLNIKSKNPIEIVNNILHKDFINIHGPEHHFLDGGALLVAYSNVTGQIDLNFALDELAKRSIKMPGAMCGYWGVCGSTTSIGARLSIIHHTTPLSNNDFYKHHMEYTSSTLLKMSKIGGPRCCKRNAYLSIQNAVNFLNDKYHIKLETTDFSCNFSNFNGQCLKERCPFYHE